MEFNFNPLDRVPGQNNPLAAFGELEEKFANFGVPASPEFPGIENFQSVLVPNEKRSFGDLLTDAIQTVSNEHEHALKLGVDFATGKPIDPHQLMLAMTKSETGLHLTSAVTTRVAQGYQTLMNMQI